MPVLDSETSIVRGNVRPAGVHGELCVPSAGGEEPELAIVDDPLTRLDLARAYLSIGQPEQAIPMLEEALAHADAESTQVRPMLENALGEAEAAVEKTERLA